MRRQAPLLTRTGSRLTVVSCVLVLAGLAVVAGCSSDAVKEAAIRELAVDSWDCVPQAPGAGELPFTVKIEDDGTFAVSFDAVSTEDAVRPAGTISGTWAIEDGDLEWGFDDFQASEKALVEGFDSLTLESAGFTLKRSWILEPGDGPDDPADEQDIVVDAHGTDSVTLSFPGGDPWTCGRQ